jgi:hypothetical protein
VYHCVRGATYWELQTVGKLKDMSYCSSPTDVTSVLVAHNQNGLGEVWTQTRAGGHKLLPSTMDKSTWGNGANFLLGGRWSRLVVQLISASKNSSVHYLTSPLHLHTPALGPAREGNASIIFFLWGEQFIGRGLCALRSLRNHQQKSPWQCGKWEMHDKEEFIQNTYL